MKCIRQYIPNEPQKCYSNIRFLSIITSRVCISNDHHHHHRFFLSKHKITFSLLWMMRWMVFKNKIYNRQRKNPQQQMFRSDIECPMNMELTLSQICILRIYNSTCRESIKYLWFASNLKKKYHTYRETYTHSYTLTYKLENEKIKKVIRIKKKYCKGNSFRLF